MEKIKLIEETINKIDDLIKEQLPESKYQFELYDLTTNTKHFRGLDEPFHWGSVYKLFVVAEIIKMSEEGWFKMDDEIELHKNVYVNGNGIVKYLTHLNKLTFTDACKMVMAVSDNLCADELLNIVGFDRINLLLNHSGCQNSKLSVNLDTMVRDVFARIENNTGATYYQSENYFNQFNISLSELLKENYTSVKDINASFDYILNSYLTEKGKTLLMQFVLTPNVHSRISACTFFSKYLLRGKTGALGFGTVNSETAAIIDKQNNSIKGYFTVSTKENRKRNFISNDVIALIGLEIVKLYEQLDKQTK